MCVFGPASPVQVFRLAWLVRVLGPPGTFGSSGLPSPLGFSGPSLAGSNLIAHLTRSGHQARLARSGHWAHWPIRVIELTRIFLVVGRIRVIGLSQIFWVVGPDRLVRLSGPPSPFISLGPSNLLWSSGLLGPYRSSTKAHLSLYLA